MKKAEKLRHLTQYQLFTYTVVLHKARLLKPLFRSQTALAFKQKIQLIFMLKSNEKSRSALKI